MLPTIVTTSIVSFHGWPREQAALSIGVPHSLPCGHCSVELKAFGIDPEKGGDHNYVYVAFSFEKKKETHKQKFQKLSGKIWDGPLIIPGQSREYVFFCVFFLFLSSDPHERPCCPPPFTGKVAVPHFLGKMKSDSHNPVERIHCVPAALHCVLILSCIAHPRCRLSFSRLGLCPKLVLTHASYCPSRVRGCPSTVSRTVPSGESPDFRWIPSCEPN